MMTASLLVLQLLVYLLSLFIQSTCTHRMTVTSTGVDFSTRLVICLISFFFFFSRFVRVVLMGDNMIAGVLNFFFFPKCSFFRTWISLDDVIIKALTKTN